MSTCNKPLHLKTAANLMKSNLVVLQEDMPMREAAGSLRNHHIGGAPVVDAVGKCVGIFSDNDLLRLAESGTDLSKCISPARPLSCSYQTPDSTSGNGNRVLCTLPAGACPIQIIEHNRSEPDKIVCNQPHCVLVDWQTVELEKLPSDEVKRYMTTDPVMVSADTAVHDLACRMIEAHTHRVIVVNDDHEPIGIVSAIDLVSEIARTPQLDSPEPTNGDSANWI